MYDFRHKESLDKVWSKFLETRSQVFGNDCV